MSSFFSVCCAECSCVCFLILLFSHGFRDRTMFGCSKWCRMLALDFFSWSAREKFDSNARDAELCVRKRKATASLASGNAREHAAVRAGGGRPRENAVPRHRQATCLMLITVPSLNHATRGAQCSSHFAAAFVIVRTKTSVSKNDNGGK